MQKTKLLVIGKRGGILQWYEHILAINDTSENFTIESFALNHNNWQERIFNKLISNKAAYRAGLLKRKLDQFQPEIVLIADLFYLDKDLIKVLAQFSCKKAHWIGDFFDERLLLTQDIIDLYCFTDSSFLDDARTLGLNHITYLPLAYNPNIFFYKNNQVKSDRLLFVGAWSTHRQNMIKDISFPMTIYGKGWDKLNKSNAIIHPYNINSNKLADLYRQHTYVLNVINKNNIRQGVNMRCFEGPASGCILVTEYVEDLNQIFDINREIISFSEPSQLTDKLFGTSINFNLAMLKVCENHTYEHRLMSIKNLLLESKY